jgi:RND superfamily putative drug exporter
MQSGLFYKMGACLYQCRRFFVLLWVLLLVSSIPFLPHVMEPFKAIGFTDQHSSSAKANDLLNNTVGYSYNRFMIMYSSPSHLMTDPDIQKAIVSSLSGLQRFPIQHQIIYPTVYNKQISPNKHTAYAVVLFKSSQEADSSLLEKFKQSIQKPTLMDMKIGGEPIFLDDTKKQTQVDLYKAEYFATPIAIVTMLIIFGSVVAASIPIVLGGVCALVLLMMLFGLGQLVTLSVFTLNIALLLGLCLSLDYSILLINRFREELNLGRSTKQALSITQATAGKAIFFSGLAVFISLSALLLFPINVLFSVGMGGLAAVLSAVLIALVLLPAILAMLGNNINKFTLNFLKRDATVKSTYWMWLVTGVVKRPWLFFISVLLLLLFLGYPFFSAKFGISDFRILPKTSESRQVFDAFKSEFGESKLAPILLIVQSKHKNILAKESIDQLVDLKNVLAKDSRIDDISSIVSISPKLTKSQYEKMFATNIKQQSPGIQKLLEITTKDNLTVMTITSKFSSNSQQTKALIRDLRKIQLSELTLDVTGTSVNSIDVLASISAMFPYALLWIVCFTYLVLLVLLRSLILPLKAVITTMLSLCASYGVLTVMIQQGFMHTFFNIEPQGMLDISLLIIIFCALFGISMDYEVFLLTRIKECFEQTKDNVTSIVVGIERSSRIISSAAVIVILICFSFMSADILMVKAFGLGIAVAVFVDAFIIRTILVPATMTLLGKWNWYLPQWMDKLLPTASID